MDHSNSLFLRTFVLHCNFNIFTSTDNPPTGIFSEPKRIDNLKFRLYNSYEAMRIRIIIITNRIVTFVRVSETDKVYDEHGRNHKLML